MNSLHLDTDIATISLFEDGVVHWFIKDGNPPLQKLIATFEQARDHFGADKFPAPTVLVRSSGASESSKEIRDYFSSTAVKDFFICGAVVVNSFLMRIGANLFLKISAPPCPTKVFTDEEKAFEWVRQFIKK